MTGFVPFSELPPAFSIGLKPVDPVHFLQIDDETPRYLKEKRDLYAERFDDIFMAEPDTEEAQQEVFDLIARAIGQPDRARDKHLPPLADIALHVPDDLILMRRNETDWRLVAASLCFPSSWNLAEKFGRPMEAIHERVPGMEERLSARIHRIFDALRPDTPLWRHNWALEYDGELRHERKENERGPAYKRAMLQGDVWLRTEYQTLHKLPCSSDILFTVKIMAESLSTLAARENGPKMMRSLLDQYHGIGDAGRSYKGISEGAEKLLTWLETHAEKEAQTA